MKNVTESAEEQHKTSNAAFREWLEPYASGAGSAREVDALMKRLRHVKSGRTFTGDEMNAR